MQCFAQENWQKALDRVNVPSYFDSRLSVYFKYSESVDGYVVTGKFFPFNKTAETGYVILSFMEQYTNKVYLYISPRDDKYTSNDIYNLVFSDSFPGYKQGNVYCFNYVAPNSSLNKESCYSMDILHPLGYYTPFQFFDVDFDGKKELLMNNWDLLRTGNTYTVYKLNDKGLIPVSEAPFNELCNEDEIDSKRRMITRISVDGAFEYIKFYYSLKHYGKAFKPYPKFVSWMSESQVNEPIHPRFQLDSVYEKVNDKEYHWNINTEK